MSDSTGDTGPDDHGEPFLDAAWTEAIDAAELLRHVLTALGMAEGFPRLRGDVNVYGRPMVTIGRIPPNVARQLATALAPLVGVANVSPTHGAYGSDVSSEVRAFGQPLYGLPAMPASVPSSPPRTATPSQYAYGAPNLAGPPLPAAARPVGEQRGLPVRGEIPQLNQMWGDPQRLPA